MSTPYESAQIILKLYELRRDPVMREARDWFIQQFHPQSMADIGAALAGENSPYFRMVAGYWDMACSFVTHGAVDRDMFIEACPEAVNAFAKVQPFLADLRSQRRPDLAIHWEQVVMSIPGIDEYLTTLRERLRALHAARQAAAAAEPVEG